MNTSFIRRGARRATALGAGTALIGAALTVGAVAPAHAASPVTASITDAFGNPVDGELTALLRDPDTGEYDEVRNIYVYDGYVNASLFQAGDYKFRFDTFNSYTEFFKDQPDLASAAVVTATDGAPVDLGAWTVDQPFVTGVVTNQAGKPLSSASITVYDAATGESIGSGSADEKGNFKVPTQAAPVKVSISSGDYALEFYNDAASLEAAAPVTATGTGANLGTVVLAPGGSISGQVTSDAGVPLEFVEVSVGGSRYDYTDKNGVYTIKNVPTGANRVSFFDPIREYAGEYYNNVPDSDEATPVNVGVGQAVGGINANLTPIPADPERTTEVTGIVKDSLGQPVVGAYVRAYATPNASPEPTSSVDGAYSNRQGIYTLTNLEKIAGENQFKLYAGAEEQGADDAFGLFGSYLGGGSTYAGAPVVTVTPGTPVGGQDFVLDRAGGIAGSVTGLAGQPLQPAVSVRGVEDGASAFAGIDYKTDSTFEGRDLRPGTYQVRFSDNSGFHAAEWWKDEPLLEDAQVITVKPGQLVGGLNAVLDNKLFAVERPSFNSDYPWIGKPITANPGVWNMQTGTDFKYEWLSGSTVLATGDTFTPTTAHSGKRLTLRVTAESGKLVGTATSKSSAKVGYQPTIKAKIKGTKVTFKIKATKIKAKKVKGTVVAKEVVKVKDDGTIKYKKVGKAKIKKGKGTLTLKKLKKGKHKITFFFTGKGKVGSGDVTKKVKVKR